MRKCSMPAVSDTRITMTPCGSAPAKRWLHSLPTIRRHGIASCMPCWNKSTCLCGSTLCACERMLTLQVLEGTAMPMLRPLLSPR